MSGSPPPLPLLLLALALAWMAPISAAEPDDSPAARNFREHVKPLLDSRCLSCHGPDKAKANLRLDSRDAILRGGDLGASAIPGNPAESLLLRAVLHTKPDLEMPPKERLSKAETDFLERWIRDGLPWPAVMAAPLAGTGSTNEILGDAWSDPRNPIRRIFHGQRLDLWSFKPLQVPSAPSPIATPGADPRSSLAPAARHPIDRFIRARLAEKGIAPAPEADRRTLARRLFLDLTGLPPTHAELDDFLHDPSPEAYPRLVERLLASPRYGEHQARTWLDVIRYSDSNGFDWDEFRPQAWRFRDYVIGAFNADKPFDQFVREQLAGDELLPGPPGALADQERLIATGYLRVGPQDNSAPLFNEQSRARAEWLADLTETTGSAFLGVTLACCRCHDHKFDPLSQADHFRLRAFFEPLRRGDDVPLDLAPEQDAIRRQHADIETRARPLEQERDEILQRARQRVRTDRLARLPETDRTLLADSKAPKSPELERRVAEITRKIEVTKEDARRAFDPAEKTRDEALRKNLDGLRRDKRPFSHGLLATDSTNPVPVTRIHFQGDHKTERDVVVPGFFSALDPNPAPIRAPVSPTTTGRRLALANWIVSPANPLTARVFANRAWQSFFGQGLVGTPNDLGLAGQRPTHPELLDWLAAEFIRNRWSVKHLHRLLVLSATYRQSTAGEPSTAGMANRLDADNHWVWRQNLRRLSAEQLRDSVLAAAGTLRHRVGGPPVWPKLPADILAANPAFLDDNAEKTKGWYPSPAEQRDVRSIFLVQKRTVKIPFLETFDLPENTTSCPRRTLSIVAPQALALLNAPEIIESARALARRIDTEVGTISEDRIRCAYRHVLQREPSPDELETCARFLSRSGLPALCRSLLNLNEFAYLD